MSASPIGFSVSFDNKRVKHLLEVAPIATRLRLRQLIEGAAIDIQREERIQAPVGVHGGSGLRGSIRYQFNAENLEAVVLPVISYAEDVEKGTQPHWTSARSGSSLYQWARLKGINPYAVQRSIARKGTKPHPFVKPTYNKMKPRVERDIASGITKLTEDLNNGRI